MAVDAILAFKVVVTPVLIGALSLAARRYGHSVGGWLVGLPLTSGPVSFFLAVEQGPEFAQAAAPGMIAGVAAVAAFGLVYAHVSRAWPWWSSLTLALAAFAVAASALAQLPQPLVPVLVGTVATLVAAYPLLPRPAAAPGRESTPRWDVPVRIATATTLVVALTSLAHALGPAWTGVLSPFPVFTSVLGAFTHKHSGPAAAQILLRGLVLGLFSFVAFFVVVVLLVARQPLWLTYTVACLVAVAVNGATWFALARGAAAPSSSPSSLKLQ